MAAAAEAAVYGDEEPRSVVGPKFGRVGVLGLGAHWGSGRGWEEQEQQASKSKGIREGWLRVVFDSHRFGTLFALTYGLKMYDMTKASSLSSEDV